MEGKMPSGGNMLHGCSYGCLDLQGSMPLQYEQKPCTPELPFAFGLVDSERRESIIIEDDVANYAEEFKLEHNEAGKSEDGSPWQRTKWTGKMVKLLVTILSYIGEDPSTDCSGSQKKVSSLLRKLGKWRCVSKVMVERGYHVSPQQCEDKFNNLNKTYRRLNDLLGRGTSCKVVENPKLLDMIDVSKQNKEDARKILSSKHLFFEEMCSYHNGNRLYLPHDPELLRSLLFILKNEDDDGLPDLSQPVLDGSGPKAGVLAEVDTAQDNGASSGIPKFSVKLFKQINDAGFADTSKPSDSNQTLNARGGTAEYNWEISGFSTFSAMTLKQKIETEIAGLGNPSCHEDNKADGSQMQCMANRTYQLEKQKLQLKSKVLDLEKQRLKWRRRTWKQELVLDEMRLENKCLKLGNECIAEQLKRIEKNGS